jgi:hypothetical protein
MISCRECQDRMLEALYDELGVADRPGFDGHVASCPECANAFAGLEQTRLAMDSRKPAPFSDEILDGVWPAFLNRLESSETARTGSRQWFVRRWVLNLAAASALVVVGVLIGRYGRFAGESGPTTPASNEAAAIAGLNLDDRVVRYLEKSKLVLMSVDNMRSEAGEETAIDLSAERRISRDLLREGSTLKKELNPSREEQLIELISQLEVTLLQIANLRDPRVPLGIELARTGIEERALLFKINLEEMRRASERMSKSRRDRESARRRIG